VLGGVLFAFAPGALAARLEIPLRVPLELVREALAKHLAAQSGGTGELWREGACRYLRLEPAKLEAAERGLLLSAPGQAMLGAEIFGTCANAADWDGTVRFILEPRIDHAGVLRVRILDSAFSDKRGDKAAGLIWQLGKRQLHPRIERFSYDLGASRTALRDILRGVAPPEQAAAMEAVVSQLQVLAPRVETSHVVVPIALEIPDAWLTTAASAGAGQSAAATPLTEAEIDALEKALEPVDAFLVYSIRQIAADSTSAALRQRLFTLLLESRYELSAIVSGDTPAGADPVRTLFIDTWNQLRAILAGAQRDGTLDGSLLRYALFIDTGDALLALDKAAPALGLALSADGLRQLARSLRPGDSADPLAYGWEVDAELMELFQVEKIPEAAPPRRSWLDFFIAPAHAQERSLDAWVPKRDELGVYGARIGGLLRETTATELQRTSLAAPYDGIYRSLVPSTALIESCWRQYVLREGKAHYLRSSADSVGLMQINQRVWRGFYDVKRLRWDTA